MYFAVEPASKSIICCPPWRRIQSDACSHNLLISSGSDDAPKLLTCRNGPPPLSMTTTLVVPLLLTFLRINMPQKYTFSEPRHPSHRVDFWILLFYSWLQGLGKSAVKVKKRLFLNEILKCNFRFFDKIWSNTPDICSDNRIWAHAPPLALLALASAPYFVELLYGGGHDGWFIGKDARLEVAAVGWFHPHSCTAQVRKSIIGDLRNALANEIHVSRFTLSVRFAPSFRKILRKTRWII